MMNPQKNKRRYAPICPDCGKRLNKRQFNEHNCCAELEVGEYATKINRRIRRKL